MIADSAARERALDTSTSFIVQAPAGSGKTELLIQRHLKLLQTVESPDAVIAITFTRKAAGEMRSRVVDALRAAASGEEPEAEHQRTTYCIAQNVLARDHQLGWNLVQNPAQLRIETIDALCAAVTRRMPWLARFGAMPEITEKAEDLYREAARNTFRHIEQGHEGLAYLLLHLDNDFQRAEQLIRQMLEKRDQWLRLTGTSIDFGTVRTTLEESLQRLIQDELATLHAGFDDASIADIAALLELASFPEARPEDLPRWTPLAELLLTKTGDWRRQLNRELRFHKGHPLRTRYEALLARLRSNDALLESLKRLRKLPAPRFTEAQWEAMKAAVSVLTLAVGELQLVFRERGRVDFAELAIRASDALGQSGAPADLALALGHKIQHILVDEFQDTSFTQFELLEKLTAGWEAGDGRTLFLVGDPMQSIYRFRQADVSLFLKAREQGLGAIRFEPLTLSVNFRARPALVDWVNRTFTPILAGMDDIESGAVAYSPSVPGAAAGQAIIEMHAFLNSKDEAKRVLELVNAATGGTVAVLVRARSHLVQIVGALKEQDISYQAIEIDQLGERPVVEDLMALTFALLHAADRVSWLAILRAPWCGLTLSDLRALANSESAATIWDALQRPDLALSEDGRARVQRILPVLERALDDRGRVPLRRWVESAWLRLGGPACVEDETALEDAAAYFDLLEGLTDGADHADFNWFREQVSALFAHADTQAGPGLQLMTIFKAKGLEFDTVILPGLGTPPRQDDPPLLLWLEQRGQLLLAPIAEAGSADTIYDYLSHLERRKAEHETARLLYVAATRAREQLHLLSCVKTKADGSVSEPSANSFLKLLWPAYAGAFSNFTHSDGAEAPSPARAIRRLPLNWKVPDPPPSVTASRLETAATLAEPPTFEWVSDRRRYIGTALHAFLQKIAREGLEVWKEARVRSEQGAYRAVLANLGVSPAELNEAANQVEAGLLRTLRDPRGRWILAEHEDAHSELSIAGFVDGALHEAVIDRTFIDENGVRWIIDYKTGQHQGGALENFLETEKRRYQDQLERYARLMVQRDDRPIRLGLYFPLLGEWREWPAPVVLRKQAQLFEL
ncbi:MAG TPA: UvrD-helicase domain-containing protein [Bryobacteraceae bacterium]|nr:UvrD-helicase domain-containing protein [Bryobacteraceae bacterium]